VQAIIPRSRDVAKLEENLQKFGIARDRCAYCGAPSSDLDHFFAVVKNKKPSGYFHSARNLVPSCGTCNQSKGGFNWEKWMFGDAKNSPKTRNVPGLEARAQKLRAYERWADLKAVAESELRAAAGPSKWDAYWERLEELKRLMIVAQTEADQIRAKLESAFGDAKE
jgi:hypothetical protein